LAHFLVINSEYFNISGQIMYYESIAQLEDGNGVEKEMIE